MRDRQQAKSSMQYWIALVICGFLIGITLWSRLVKPTTTVTSSLPPNSPTPMACLEVLIPLYIYPTHYNPAFYRWPLIATAHSQILIRAIINPENGAGTGPPNRDYAQGLQDLRAAHVPLLGYVSTRYGNRNPDEVKAEIDLYEEYYEVNGIFLDEAASQASQLNYYQDLYAYSKAKPHLEQVVLNQGTHPDEGYLSRPAADTVVIFENYGREWGTYQPPAYISTYPAERFAVLIHSVPDEEAMKQALDLALERQIRYVYVTDDSPDAGDRDPWNQLPSFWAAEVNYIEALNQSSGSCSGNLK
jgi:hypothetical protein